MPKPERADWYCVRQRALIVRRDEVLTLQVRDVSPTRGTVSLALEDAPILILQNQNINEGHDERERDADQEEFTLEHEEVEARPLASCFQKKSARDAAGEVYRRFTHILQQA